MLKRAFPNKKQQYFKLLFSKHCHVVIRALCKCWSQYRLMDVGTNKMHEKETELGSEAYMMGCQSCNLKKTFERWSIDQSTNQAKHLSSALTLSNIYISVFCLAQFHIIIIFVTYIISRRRVGVKITTYTQYSTVRSPTWGLPIISLIHKLNSYVQRINIELPSSN